MTDLGIGDLEVARLTVTPADGTTVAALTVTAPDGTTGTPGVSGGTVDPDTDTQVWTSDPVTYDQAGRWLLDWVVTGTGSGAETQEVYVVASPTAGGPTWTPGRSRVAAYVPHRTLVRSTSSTTQSADAYAWTWDSTTTPPGTTVDRLIADGVAYVLGRVGTLSATLYDMASVIVSLYAAAFIERSWPDGDQSLQRANDMERRMDTMLTTLAEANNTANETGDYGIDIAVPYWSWPPADSRFDDPNAW